MKLWSLRGREDDTFRSSSSMFPDESSEPAHTEKICALFAWLPLSVSPLSLYLSAERKSFHGKNIPPTTSSRDTVWPIGDPVVEVVYW